ncbi:MAG: ubiquinol-cytochrome c reductase iron-sulfur subunit [Actinomycetota bacterium]
MTPQRRIALALAASIAASAGLVVVYLSGGHPQWEGALLGFALGGIGWALVVAAHALLGGEGVSEERPPLASQPSEREAVAADLSAPTSRRSLLLGLLGGALATLGVALVFPIRSLGRRPGRVLHETAWRRGVRLVDSEGVPITVDSLPVGGAITAFPEGSPHAADSILMLVRMEETALSLPPERTGWAPEGYLAYSKICTHAGCPVGLFDSDTGLLVCPCHQSTFRAREGATPEFGPAARPLPQLPLEVDEDGSLVAAAGFPEPVGPGFWSWGEGSR